MRIAALAILAAMPALAQTDAKSTISGRLVDDIAHQGIQTARVSLFDAKDVPRIATSDQSGAFSFQDLTQGPYRLQVEKAGFFAPRMQEVRTGSYAAVDLGDIVLTRMRAISGKVEWNDHEPAVGMAVQAGTMAAGGAVIPDYSRVTNERGEYGIYDLKPGRYVVMASSASFSFGSNPRPRIGLPTFYPNSPTPAGAVAVDLRKTAEVSDISLTLQERPGVTVEGTVLPSEEYPAGTGVLLGFLVDGIFSNSFGTHPVNVGEKFRFTDVPEGDYVFIQSGGAYCCSYWDVHVGNTPLKDLKLKMSDPVAVDITVELDPGDGKRTSTGPDIRLDASFAKLGRLGNARMRTEDSAWVAAGVARGATYAMTIRGIPPGAYVALVTQGTREDHTGPFEFVASEDPVHVLLKGDGGQVSGVVRSGNGAAGEAFVVLAPHNRKAIHRFVTATASRDGSFQLIGIAPGEYDLFAFARDEEGSYRDEAYLSAFANRGKPVTVTANGTLQVVMELVRQER